jgi:tyrosine-protein kinase Etk/Wzc
MKHTNSNIESDKIDLLEILFLVSSNKIWIITTTLIFTVITTLYSLSITPQYEAKVLLLPPAQQSNSTNLLSSLGGLGSLANVSMAGKDPNSLYIGFIKSNRLHQNLAERLNLKKDFNVSSNIEAVRYFKNSIKLSTDKETQFSTLTYIDSDQKRAVKIANALVNELKLITKELGATDATQKRRFAEEQFLDIKNKLSDTEVSLKQLQQRTGVLALDVQSKATIDAMTTLKTAISSKVIQLKTLSNYATDNNMEVKKIQSDIDGMKAELNSLNKGSTDNIMISKSSAPEIGLEYVRKLRDVKYYETMYEILAKQFEMAKMDEAKEGTPINVLEPATLADCKKVTPQKVKFIMVGFTFGIFAGIFLALFIGIFKKSTNYLFIKKFKLALIGKHYDLH